MYQRICDARLANWGPIPCYHRHLWTPLEDWFRLHGYELFVTRPPGKLPGLRPKNPYEIRAPDQYHAIIAEDTKAIGWTATHTVSILVSTTPLYPR